MNVLPTKWSFSNKKLRRTKKNKREMGVFILTWDYKNCMNIENNSHILEKKTYIS